MYIDRGIYFDVMRLVRDNPHPLDTDIIQRLLNQSREGHLHTRFRLIGRVDQLNDYIESGVEVKIRRETGLVYAQISSNGSKTTRTGELSVEVGQIAVDVCHIDPMRSFYDRVFVVKRQS